MHKNNGPCQRSADQAHTPDTTADQAQTPDTTACHTILTPTPLACRHNTTPQYQTTAALLFTIAHWGARQPHLPNSIHHAAHCHTASLPQAAGAAVGHGCCKYALLRGAHISQLFIACAAPGSSSPISLYQA